MLKIGSHVSFKKPNYLVGSAEEAISYGANSMMIFLGPPQNSKRIDVKEYNFDQYLKQFSNIINQENIVIHAPYIINPASVNKWMFAKEFLIKEIERTNYIGAKYIVLHPGSMTTFTREETVNTLINTLKEVLQETDGAEILLEIMSGKGTQICDSLEEIAHIIEQVNSPRLGICFDTCHAWDAGIDIKNIDELINKLETLKILNKIKVFHVNDSLNDINSKKDRHANIGQGFIGLETLKTIVNHPKFTHAIMIVETPWVNDKAPYKEEIKMLKSN